MSFTDTLIVIFVLIGFFLLAYSSLRNQGLGETLREIMEVFSERKEDLKDNINEMKYVN